MPESGMKLILIIAFVIGFLVGLFREENDV